MRSPRTAVAAALVCALTALAFPAASSGQSALEEYQRTGRIDPCSAQKVGTLPNDIEQYAPDFRAALEDALRQGCRPAGVSNTKPTETDELGAPVVAGSKLPPGSQYVPKPPAPPKPPFRDDKVTSAAPLAANAGTRAPAPILALAIMASLALVGGGVAATWRLMGWGTEWAAPVRHGFSELGLRLGAVGATSAGWARDRLARRRA